MFFWDFTVDECCIVHPYSGETICKNDKKAWKKILKKHKKKSKKDGLIRINVRPRMDSQG